MENIHLGAYCIIIKNSKVLLIKKIRGPYTGKWDVPGGKIEFGEKIADALKREVFEETGHHIHKIQFIGYEETFENFDNKKYHLFGVFFKADILGGKIKDLGDNIDSGGAVWISLDKINKKNLAKNPYNILKTFNAFIP